MTEPPAASETRLRQQLHRVQKGRCYLCGWAFSPSGRQRSSFEHVRPRAHGGKNLRNKLLAHIDCNGDKADRLPYPCELIYLDAAYTRLGMPG